jgi:3-dehydroquinate dehydratase
MLYHLSYIPKREKYNKLCKVYQVILPLIKGVGSLSASVRYLDTMSNASNAVDMATATRHTDTI